PIYGFAGSGETEAQVIKTSANLKTKTMESKNGVIGWLDIEIKNFGVIPTATAQAIKVKAVRPDKLIIDSSKNVTILGRTNPPNSQGKVTNFKAEDSNEIELGSIDGRSSKSFRLLVKVNFANESHVTVNVDTQRGGKLWKKVPIQFGN
ncbi:MAG: hypothetical protein MUC94_18085, partial [bacterium]|nr:hypothetical protein [bacterium]